MKPIQNSKWRSSGAWTPKHRVWFQKNDDYEAANESKAEWKEDMRSRMKEMGIDAKSVHQRHLRERREAEGY